MVADELSNLFAPIRLAASALGTAGAEAALSCVQAIGQRGCVNMDVLSELFVSHNSKEAGVAAPMQTILSKQSGDAVRLFASSDITRIQGGDPWLKAHHETGNRARAVRSLQETFGPKTVRGPAMAVPRKLPKSPSPAATH